MLLPVTHASSSNRAGNWMIQCEQHENAVLMIVVLVFAVRIWIIKLCLSDCNETINFIFFLRFTANITRWKQANIKEYNSFARVVSSNVNPQRFSVFSRLIFAIPWLNKERTAFVR